jgi:hypothetical protein
MQANVVPPEERKKLRNFMFEKFSAELDAAFGV